MGRTTTETPTPEKKVKRNIYRWERLTDMGEPHGLRSEVYHLKALAQLLDQYFDPEESYLLQPGRMQDITAMLIDMVDDLDKALDRVVALNIREIEAETQQAAD